MSIIYLLLAVICTLAAVASWIFILIEAFKDEVWKGVLFFLCGFYALYYCLFEFEHDNKWQLVILALGGTTMAAGFASLAH